MLRALEPPRPWPGSAVTQPGPRVAGDEVVEVARVDDPRRSGTGWSARTAGVVGCVLGVMGIALADYLTGFQLSFSIFYLVPVLLGARVAGRGAAISLSILSALAWYVADATAGHPYAYWAIPIWNSATRLAIFLTVGLLLVSLRERLDLEHRLSRVDPLTELLNRRAFIEALRAEVARARRTCRPFALAFLDLDDFKLVNDRLGHDAGDALLRSVAAQLRARLRGTDVVARLGGDEFAVLMPETELGAARVVLDEVHEVIGRAMRARSWQVGLSVGLLGSSGAPELNEGELLTLADKLMYQAKQKGKNTIEQRGLGA